MRLAVAVPLTAAAALLASLSSGAQAQSMMDQMIFSKCSSAMNADFQKAGKTPPDGLVQKTCNCVVKTMDQTHNIELSKQTCTQQAMQGS